MGEGGSGGGGISRWGAVVSELLYYESKFKLKKNFWKGGGGTGDEEGLEYVICVTKIPNIYKNKLGGGGWGVWRDGAGGGGGGGGGWMGMGER